MRSLKQFNLVLFFILTFFCSLVTAGSDEVDPVDVSNSGSGNDFIVAHVQHLGVPSDYTVPEFISVPHLSLKLQRTEHQAQRTEHQAQRTEHRAIKLYSNDWWVTVYGSLNGGSTHMMALCTFTILSGLFLCTMGFRLIRPALAVMGYLTFAVIMWTALANCKPPGGYSNDLVVMIAVPMCAGILGAVVYYMFSGGSFYFSGALAGFALALFICSWKYNLLIENMIGRLGFIVGLAIVSGAAGRFLPRDSLFFTTSFVGAYTIMLGVDCIARKGYIAAFESLLNLNPNSQVEYTVSPFVYIFLALTLALFFISYGWQYYFNLMLPARKKYKLAQKQMIAMAQ